MFACMFACMFDGMFDGMFNLAKVSRQLGFVLALGSAALSASQFELKYDIKQNVFGSNTVQVWQMFALDRYSGARVERVVLRGRDITQQIVTYAEAVLVDQYQRPLDRVTLSPYVSDFYLNAARGILGHDLRDLKIILPQDTYLDQIRIVLSSAGSTYPQPPYPSPEPPVAVGQINFRGVIEGQHLALNAYSRQQLFTQCLESLRRAGISRADDVMINGRNYRNRKAYWYRDSLCALVVLNAKVGRAYDSHSRIVLDAVVANEFPVNLELSFDELQSGTFAASQLLRQYLPLLLPARVSELEIWGRSYKAGPGAAWSAQQIEDFLIQNLRGASR